MKVGTVGPFRTTGGTTWDHDPGQHRELFESSNSFANRRCSLPDTLQAPELGGQVAAYATSVG